MVQVPSPFVESLIAQCSTAVDLPVGVLLISVTWLFLFLNLDKVHIFKMGYCNIKFLISSQKASHLLSGTTLGEGKKATVND